MYTARNIKVIQHIWVNNGICFIGEHHKSKINPLRSGELEESTPRSTQVSLRIDVRFFVDDIEGILPKRPDFLKHKQQLKADTND